jgi:hypothetical protein
MSKANAVVSVLLGIVLALALIFASRPVSEADAAVKAQSSGVVSLTRVFLKSDKAAKKACKDAEVFWQGALRCEGWFGGGCYRQSLSQPNHVYCYPNYFMSSWKADHIDCNRRVHYHAPNGFTIRQVSRGTTKWKCRVSKGLPT